jgi:diaminopimelate decarboxylase
MSGVAATLIFEPGRLIAGNAGILVSRVIYVKEALGKTYVIVDAAMNDLIRPSLYDAYHEIVPVEQQSGRIMRIADVVGPVCETGDIFAQDRPLPECRAGELLAFRSAGAYGAVMGSTYNARPLAPEVMVRGAEYRMIRHRPSYEEMLAAQSIPVWT